MIWPLARSLYFNWIQGGLVVESGPRPLVVGGGVCFWLEAYQFATDRGAQALNDYARASDPFSKVGKIQISVEVASVVRASDNSFRVAWTERHYVDGALAATERWSAILTIVVQPPTNAERLRKNPLGIYVHAFNWSKELG